LAEQGWTSCYISREPEDRKVMSLIDKPVYNCQMQATMQEIKCDYCGAIGELTVSYDGHRKISESWSHFYIERKDFDGETIHKLYHRCDKCTAKQCDAIADKLLELAY
jgi:hypothetical protein